MFKFFKSSYLDSHSSESIHIWTIGTLGGRLITQEAMALSRHDWKIVDWDVKPQHNQPTLGGRLSYHDSWPQGPCPGVGLEIKMLGHLFPIFCYENNFGR